MFQPLMDYYVEIITRNPDDEVYQTSIKDFLKILEMSIRKTIIENPNGIFKELPSANDIINKDQEEVSEDPEQEEFRKTLKYFTNQLIVKQTVSIQEAEAREKERLKAREQSMSVPGKTDESIQRRMIYGGPTTTDNPLVTTPIPEIQPQPPSGSSLFPSRSSLFPSGSPFDSQELVATQPDNVATQPDNVATPPPTSPTSESMITETTSNTSQDSIGLKREIPPENTVSSTVGEEEEEKNKRQKLPLNGGYNKMTSKNYKKSNNNYSIKNKQLVSKNKSIKHNKRKHTKTYKRN